MQIQTEQYFNTLDTYLLDIHNIDVTSVGLRNRKDLMRVLTSAEPELAIETTTPLSAREYLTQTRDLDEPQARQILDAYIDSRVPTLTSTILDPIRDALSPILDSTYARRIAQAATFASLAILFADNAITPLQAQELPPEPVNDRPAERLPAMLPMDPEFPAYSEPTDDPITGPSNLGFGELEWFGLNFYSTQNAWGFKVAQQDISPELRSELLPGSENALSNLENIATRAFVLANHNTILDGDMSRLMDQYKGSREVRDLVEAVQKLNGIENPNTDVHVGDDIDFYNPSSPNFQNLSEDADRNAYLQSLLTVYNTKLGDFMKYTLIGFQVMDPDGSYREAKRQEKLEYERLTVDLAHRDAEIEGMRAQFLEYQGMTEQERQKHAKGIEALSSALVKSQLARIDDTSKFDGLLKKSHEDNEAIERRQKEFQASIETMLANDEHLSALVGSGGSVIDLGQAISDSIQFYKSHTGSLEATVVQAQRDNATLRTDLARIEREMHSMATQYDVAQAQASSNLTWERLRSRYHKSRVAEARDEASAAQKRVSELETDVATYKPFRQKFWTTEGKLRNATRKYHEAAWDNLRKRSLAEAEAEQATAKLEAEYRGAAIDAARQKIRAKVTSKSNTYLRGENKRLTTENDTLTSAERQRVGFNVSTGFIDLPTPDYLRLGTTFSDTGRLEYGLTLALDKRDGTFKQVNQNTEDRPDQPGRADRYTTLERVDESGIDIVLDGTYHPTPSVFGGFALGAGIFLNAETEREAREILQDDIPLPGFQPQKRDKDGDTSFDVRPIIGARIGLRTLEGRAAFHIEGHLRGKFEGGLKHDATRIGAGLTYFFKTYQ